MIIFLIGYYLGSMIFNNQPPEERYYYNTTYTTNNGHQHLLLCITQHNSYKSFLLPYLLKLFNNSVTSTTITTMATIVGAKGVVVVVVDMTMVTVSREDHDKRTNKIIIRMEEAEEEDKPL